MNFRVFAVAALAAFVALLMLPNLTWLWVGSGPNAWMYALLVPALLLLAWFALFGSRLWLGCLLLTPFAMLVPIETFYIARYRHPSTAEVLATVFVTNTQETIEFLGANLMPIVLATLGCLILSLATSTFSFKLRLRWTHRVRGWVVTATAALPVCFFCLARFR